MQPQYSESRLQLYAQYGYNYIQLQQKSSQQQAEAQDHHPSLQLPQLSALFSQ